MTGVFLRPAARDYVAAPGLGMDFSVDHPERPVDTVQHGHVLAVSWLDLTFGGIKALRNVGLTVRPGEIRAVIGPNGAGKSSLLNVISGLYRADRGSISLNGRTFAHVPPHDLARLGVSRTFQNLALFPGLTVAANIAAGLTFQRKASLVAQVLQLPNARAEDREITARVAEVAELMDLTPHLDRPVATLPYGLQKRVELARAVVAKPRLMLLDEPMAGMTATEKGEMVRHIRAARDQLGLAVVLIEHDIGVVMDLSDRIAVLDHGVKIADGSPTEIRRDPDVIAAYLGVEAA